MLLPRPSFINLSVEQKFATCFFFNEEVTQSTFSSTVHRSAFEQAFPSIDLSTVYQLSYEPQRNIVTIVRERSQTEFYNDPETYSPELQEIVKLSRQIYTWFYDEHQLLNAPSPFHTYDREIHEWSITPENEKKLSAENVGRQLTNELNAFARTRGYDNINSACTYATSSDPVFRAEGERAIQVRDDWWVTFRSIYQEVETGTRPAPQSFQEIRAEFANPEWPELS